MRRPCAPRSPTTIRDGATLSASACPSRRNSGAKTIRSLPVSARIRSTNPTGMVDRTRIRASAFTDRTWPITASTDEVLKRFVTGS